MDYEQVKKIKAIYGRHMRYLGRHNRVNALSLLNYKKARLLYLCGSYNSSIKASKIALAGKIAWRWKARSVYYLLMSIVRKLID